MKLYYARGACSLASHIALVESGTRFTAVRVDLAQHQTENGQDFFAISPRGYVPAIQADDVGILTENPAVLTYIADHSGTLPSGEHLFRLLEWIGFVGTEIHGEYHPLFGQDNQERQAKAKQSLTDKYELTRDLMKGHEWLVGDSPTVADNYLFVTLLWANKFGIALPPELVAFRKRNLDRPAVQQAMANEGLS